MLNDIAEHIFVKNLRRRNDRREFMAEQMQRLGLAYTFLDVADDKGTKLSPMWWNAINGLTAIRYAKAARLKSVLVLDDDCLFIGDFNERLTGLWPSMPENWDMVSFGEIYGNKTDIAPGIVTSNYSWGGHATLVKETIYDKCLEVVRGETWADEEINLRLKSYIKFYAFSPYLITQRADFSDLKNEYVTNDKFN